MDVNKLEEIGERLRSLGHERREAVQRIVADTRSDTARASGHYQDLDRISGEAIGLMEQQRSLIRTELSEHVQM